MFRIDKYPQIIPNSPTDKGIAIIENRVKSPLVEFKIPALRIEVTIVAGPDLRCIPTNRGIRLITAVAREFIKTVITCFDMFSTATSPGRILKVKSIKNTSPSRKNVESNTKKKVKVKMIINFAVKIFFRLIG